MFPLDICWLMFSGYASKTTDDLRNVSSASPKWCARRGFQLSWIWVREIGANGALHTHILMHVPPWLMEDGVFQIAFERSFEPEGGPSHEKAILIKPAYSPHAKLAYMLKGMRRAEAIKFKVRASFQGEIEGKRVGFTQNIGPRARARSTYNRNDTWTRQRRAIDAVSSDFVRNFKLIARACEVVAACTLHT